MNGLTNGTQYVFVVRAGNGDDRWSGASVAARATPATVPDPPTSIRTIRLSESVFFYWTAPPEDGGADVQGYKYQYASGVSPADSDYSNWDTAGSRQNSYQFINDLTAGESYHIRLLAHNRKGEGAFISTNVTLSPPPPPPPPPVSNLTAEAGDGQVTLSWDTSSNLGSRLVRFEYRVDRGADYTWGGWRNTNSRETTTVVTGLLNGIEYAFKVRAVTTFETSQPTNIARATPTGTPGVVSSFTATRGNGFVRLSWTAPTNTGGSPINGYKYRFASGASPAEADYTPWQPTRNVNSHTASNLTNGVRYNFQVRAVNSVGDGDVSRVLRRRPAAPPGVVSSLSSNRGDGWVELSWSPPDDSGTLPVNGYQYRYANVPSPQETDFTRWADTDSNTSHRVTGLSNDLEHQFQVRARSDAGAGVGSSSLAQTPIVPVPPGTPNLTAATAGDEEVTLAWSPPTSSGTSPITHYEYQHAAGPLESYTAWTNCGNGRSYTISSLTNGTRYSFHVRAVSADGAGSGSNIRSARPRPDRVPPGKVRSLTAAGTNASVTLYWSPPTDTGTDPITHYEYSYVTGSGNSQSSFSNWESTEDVATVRTVLRLTNGVLHTFVVRAVSDAGAGEASDPSSATPRLPRPNPPRDLVATNGIGQVSLSWTEPIPNSSGAIDHYEYRIDTYDDNTWRSWESTDSNQTSVVITNLSNGTLYAFLVRAVNGGGNSLASNKVTATPGGVPSAPRNLTARPGDAEVYLSWDEPASDGGSAIIDYEYRRDRYDDGTWTEWATTGETNTYETFVNLQNGIVHVYQIRAVNSNGAGAASAGVRVTLVRRPGAVSSFSSTRGDGWVELSWSAPSESGSATIDHYEYRYSTSTSSNYMAWSDTDSNTSHRVTGLTNDVEYYFQVRAVSGSVNGATSSSLAQTPIVPDPPGTPNLTAATPGDGRVTLRWAAPSNNGTSPITYYEYQHATGTLESYTAWTHCGSSSSYTITGLTNGTRYSFHVRAVSADGTSSGSNVRSTTPTEPVDEPDPPTRLSATGGNASVSLSWTTPSDNGGAPILDYEYRKKLTSNTSWENWVSTDSTSTSYSVSSLANNTSYSFQVRAVNRIGSSLASNTATATTDNPILPSSPRNFTASAEDGQVTLSWDIPTTRGSGITGYDYRYDTSDDGSWQNWRSTGSRSTSYTVTSLTNGTLYAFEVRARNSNGAGSTSSKVTATPERPMDLPSAPTNLTATVEDSATTLSWTAPTDTGSGIIDYQWRADTGNNGIWSVWKDLNQTSTTQHFSTMTNGTVYVFQIRAVSADGAGPASDSVSVTPTEPGPPDTEPGAPEDLAAGWGNGVALAGWSAPSDDGGSSIRRYEYRYRQSGGSWNSWTSTGTNTYAALNGLTNEVLHYLEVRAVNSIGAGPATSTSGTPTAVTRPASPTSLTAEGEDQMVELDWYEPDSDGGSSITSYQYRYRQQSSSGSWGSWSSWSSTGSTDPWYDGTGLTNGTNYGFQVRAVNAIGSSSTSNTATAMPVEPPPSEPDSPTGLSASAGTTSGEIDLSWTAPDDNGSSITGYSYAYCKYENGWRNWTSYSSTGSTTTSYTVTGLESGELYRFRVRAINSIGTSRVSRVAQTRAP